MNKPLFEINILQRKCNVIYTRFLSYLHHYLEEEVTSNSGTQHNQNEIDGPGTWPEFEKETHFYVPVGVIFFEFEDCSNYATEIESRNLLHDETEFVSSNEDTVSHTRTAFLCIEYEGTWAALSSGE
jgi:hypothetical protein